MGALGSGRQRGQSGRRTTDDLPALDVRALKREGQRIAPGQEQLEGVAPLAWTSCSFGGERPWFVCPGEGCGRRAAILYDADKSSRWLCRSCLDLAYPSQRESPLRRARRRAEKARSKLGAGSAPRPKGMHHTTFERLHGELLQATADYVALYNERAVKLSRELSLLSLSGSLTEEHLQLLDQLERERIEIDL